MQNVAVLLNATELANQSNEQCRIILLPKIAPHLFVTLCPRTSMCVRLAAKGHCIPVRRLKMKTWLTAGNILQWNVLVSISFVIAVPSMKVKKASNVKFRICFNICLAQILGNPKNWNNIMLTRMTPINFELFTKITKKVKFCNLSKDPLFIANFHR